MITWLIQLVAIFLVPLLIIRFHQFRLTKLIGTIGMAYLLGLIVAGLIFGLGEIGILIELNTDIGEIGSFTAIGVAIPLLLFSANLQEAKKLTKTVLISYASMIVTVTIVVAIAFLIYGRTMEHGPELSAMAVGVYTGGTPNLNAIANIFGLNRTLIAIANLSDMIIGAILYMFLLLLCKPLLIKILKPSSQQTYLRQESKIHNTEDLGSNKIQYSRPLFYTILLAFGMAVLSALSGIIVWMILGSEEGRMLDLVVPSLMIGVTVFGIIASFNKRIREVEGTNVVGQYLILVFSFALASSIDFNQLQENFGGIFIFYTIITVGILIVQVLFAKILKIDADCTIVTITAGIYGPAFIPAITKQIKNDALTVPGLICGSIGYAIGTFLGVALGLLFLL